MRKKFIQYLLYSLAVIGLITFIDNGFSLLKNSYEDSYQYEQFVQEKITEVSPYLFVDKLKLNDHVSSSEINQYREYYGSLDTQKFNIASQYNDSIERARAENNVELEQQLLKERNTKLEDVSKNFQDDEYVRNKIGKMKKAVFEEYIRNVKSDSSYASYWSKEMVYHLQDRMHGTTFQNGELQSAGDLLKKFSSTSHAISVPIVSSEYESINETELNAAGLYSIQDLINWDGYSVLVGSAGFKENSLPSEVLDSKNYFNYKKEFFSILWVIALLSGLADIALTYKRKRDRGIASIPRWMSNWKLEFRLIATVIPILIAFLVLEVFKWDTEIVYERFGGSQLSEWILYLLIAILLASFGLMNGSIFIKDIKTANLSAQWENSLSKKFLSAMRLFFDNRSLAFKAIFALVAIFLAGFGFMVSMMQVTAFLLYIPLFVVVIVPVLYIIMKSIGRYNALYVATEKLAQGTLHQDVRIKGKSVFAMHANHLNELRHLVKHSESEQAKSERLKTELITNVSHDLRTPLTSIITYTDLLKNEKLTEVERANYLEVLERKSARMKTLIDDLFEVSKMTSGTITLMKATVDLSQLLSQTLAEQPEAPVEFRLKVPTSPLYAKVDGQKIWRVFDNLLQNAQKYSLEGTRVYVELLPTPAGVSFTIKNVTKEELGGNVEELFERFKRGDSSRNTDGSGLGLAIVQSIVELHEGSMKLDVDGDLFKVSIFLPSE
ncbi:sensor histidine kinase [Paenisporosarcina cavernae]|uniref:histidine kinase n=1 Tax=Paenisporosarcina cavernae TaxID=2320858 RepID=A0A385YSM3_9BACL|nr:HAMP domain-containing sensor histidine kinase [Paenisporosarcina cavernae]AYC28652.1 sensor histidine kinase [Paenisporosarcina cavernae]